MDEPQVKEEGSDVTTPAPAFPPSPVPYSPALGGYAPGSEYRAVGNGYQPPVYTPPSADPQWAHGHWQQTGDGRIDVPIEKVGRGRAVAGGATGLAALLLKAGVGLKFLFPFLLKAKFIVPLLINIAVYGWLFGRNFGFYYGLAFGVGFVTLLLIHESGHLVAARIEGLKVSLPYLIPFMGAVIMLREQPRDARSEAIIGIGGPIFGTLGAMATFGLAATLGSASKLGLMLAVLSGYGFFLNLFNMIPFSPLDGGRIVGAVWRWINVLGLGIVLAGVLFGYLSGVVLIFLLLLGGFGTFRRFTHPENPTYFQVSTLSRLTIGVSYLALLGVLIAGMEATSGYIEGIKGF